MVLLFWRVGLGQARERRRKVGVGWWDRPSTQGTQTVIRSFCYQWVFWIHLCIVVGSISIPAPPTPLILFPCKKIYAWGPS
jgi:hypothetical protein